MDKSKMRVWQIQAVKLKAFGLGPTEIAKRLGVNRITAGKFLSSLEGKKELQKEIGTNPLIQDLKEALNELSMKSIEILRTVLKDPDPHLRPLQVKVAQDILDRLGIKESDKKEITHTHILEGLQQAIERGSGRKKRELIGTA